MKPETLKQAYLRLQTLRREIEEIERIIRENQHLCEGEKREGEHER